MKLKNSTSQTNSAKFYPKPAHFEKKCQVAPNAVVFHRKLSDGAKIFILALNGIITAAPGWTPIQSDLQKRLGWGRDKIRKIIKECVAYGYLKVSQSRDKEGKQFSHNEFEFDIDGGYVSQLPVTEKPVTENPSTALPPLPSKKNNHTYEKNNKQSPPTPPAPVAVSPEPVVVCSLSIDREKKEAAIRAVCPDISISTLKVITKHSHGEIEDAIGSLTQAKLSAIVSNPIGYLVSAVKLGWKPNKGTSTDEAMIAEHQGISKPLDGLINHAKTVRIDYLKKHIEFVYITTSKAPTCVKYGTTTFIEEIRGLLDKNGF